MSENSRVSSLEEVYNAVVAAFAEEAPAEIAVVGDDGTVVYRPPS